MRDLADASSKDPLNLPGSHDCIHRSHRFPGKIHPPLVAYLLDRHESASVVADPMCGSGTVGVEAVVRDCQALMTDLDPLSALLAEAKTQPVHPVELWRSGQELLENASPLPEEGEFDPDEATAEARSILSDTDFSVPVNVDYWFDPHIVVGYAQLLKSFNKKTSSSDASLQTSLLLVLSSIVRRISRADPAPVSGLEITKIRRRQLEDGLEFDIEKEYKKSLRLLSRGYEEMLEYNSLGESSVFNTDARSFNKICESSGLRPEVVITSPPYCNAIEYTRRHRLETEWLGFWGASTKEAKSRRVETSRSFIGSTTVRQESLRQLDPVPHQGLEDTIEQIEAKGKQRKANLLRQYFHDAEIWLDEIQSAIVEEGVLYLIVGRSKSHGEIIDTPGVLVDIAESVGFSLQEEIEYRLKDKKMQFPTSGNGTGSEVLVQLTP